MYNVFTYLVNFCRATSGHRFANRILASLYDPPGNGRFWKSRVLYLDHHRTELNLKTDFLSAKQYRDINRHTA